MKKTVITMFLILTSFIYAAEMETILDLNLNERAPETSKEKIWKQIKFEVPYTTTTEVTVIGTANDNGSRDDDDIKWGIDDEDFGWATNRSWDGRELKGNKKTVQVTKELLKGDHYLKFWVDQRPTLNRITIKIEKKTIVKIPEITAYEYIKDVGFKIEWENQDKNYEYDIMRKKGDTDYVKVANVSSNAYIDTEIEPNNKYRYKIGILSDATNTINYTDEVEIDLTKKSKPLNLVGETKDKQITINWDIENQTDIANYNIYRKEETESEYKKHSLSISNAFIDKKVEEGVDYNYKVSAVFLDGRESELSESITLKVKKPYTPQGTVDVYPEELVAGEKATVYFSARRSKQLRTYRRNAKRRNPSVETLPEQMYIHYGFNNWDPEYTLEESEDPKMIYDEELKYWKYEMTMPGYAKEFNFVFKDELDNWDTNWAKDYKETVKGDLEPPQLPVGIEIHGKKDLVYLKWDEMSIEDLSHYELLKSDTRSMEDPKIIRVTSNQNYYVDRELEYYMNNEGDWDNKYYYQLRAIDYSGNESGLSEVFEGTPKNIGVSFQEKFEWTPQEPSRGETVKVYYNNSDGSLSDVKKIYARVGYNNWQTQKDDLVELKFDDIFDVYYFEDTIKPGVKSINVAFTDSNREKWDKNNWIINVKPDTTPPASIDNLEKEVKSDRVIIDWNKNVDEDLDGYNVYRNDRKVNSNIINDNSYVDTEIEEDVKYIYSVTAVDLSGNESGKTEIIVNTLRNIITTPPEAIYNTTFNQFPLKLIASVDMHVQWAVDILDDNGDIVRQFNGAGSNIVILWNGRNNKNELIEPGRYKYRVRVLSIEDVGEKEVQMVISK